MINIVIKINEYKNIKIKLLIQYVYPFKFILKFGNNYDLKNKNRSLKTILY